MRQRRGGGGGSAPSGRLWETLREHKAIGLRDVRPLGRPEGAPEEVELAAGLVHGRPAALVAGRAGGVDLVGWATVALELARAHGPAVEAWVFAPLVHRSMRELAGWLAGYGFAVRLASVPGLAERPGALLGIEPAGEVSGAHGASPRVIGEGTLERVLRVAEGAGAVTTAGAVRAVEDAHVVYMRGVRIARIASEAGGVSVHFLEPEKRHVHIDDGSFPRWGPDLFEELVDLAQDPRLLDSVGAMREAVIEASADAIRATVLTRWMPWNGDGADPVDWVGLDAEARPVLGMIRPSVGLSDVPALVAAAWKLQTERDVWAPGSVGAARVMVTGRLDEVAREVLESLDLEVESRQDVAAGEPEPGRERRGSRRRSRRRRRGRGGEDRESRTEPDELVEVAGAPAEAPEDGDAGEPLRAIAAPPRRNRPRVGEGLDSLEREDAEDAEDAFGAEGGEPRDEGQREAERAPSADRSEASRLDAMADEDRGESAERAVEVRPGAELEDSDELEIVESLDDVDELQAAPEEAAAPPALTRRRPKAAIAVRNDPDSIVAALVLARERRNVPFFYVCAQHELMNFLRGKATDIDENTDLMLVGFTAQPVPSETIAAAAVYRGQISWFDHHEWPIEDLEKLREAIGEDAIRMTEGSSSPLSVVMDISERRSRFTDKLLDFSGRRLSENDMEKWGYSLFGLLQRMVSSPGDYRNDIQPVLAGKPSELPAGENVYARESEWLGQHQPRLVCFGEYQLVVGHVPDGLDAGEIGRRLRQVTGARISVFSREGDPMVIVGYNEEKRHINVLGLLEQLDDKLPWLHARPGGDRAGRVEIDDLAQHPERVEALIGEIVRHKSVLYG